ncbi:hypothetical protein FA13DRAFT_640430 [Coprinellus micaceus]|uniref:Uncharacterized protein n=1 Tax=Coprinellus micaceus TaxID=71717 RepID=A0A4Y7T5K8_COPMI|nr:hypothetical protein FA13DRAFT_640430 [Coprinellus micaceus]
MEASGWPLLVYSRKKYHLYRHLRCFRYGCRPRRHSWALIAPSIGRPSLKEDQEPTTVMFLPRFSMNLLELLSKPTRTTLETHNPWNKVASSGEKSFHNIPCHIVKFVSRWGSLRLSSRGYVLCPITEIRATAKVRKKPLLHLNVSWSYYRSY